MTHYQITARRNEYQAKTQTFTVGGDSATLDFGLQRGEGISIRVGDALTAALRRATRDLRLIVGPEMPERGVGVAGEISVARQ